MEIIQGIYSKIRCNNNGLCMHFVNIKRSSTSVQLVYGNHSDWELKWIWNSVGTIHTYMTYAHSGEIFRKACRKVTIILTLYTVISIRKLIVLTKSRCCYNIAFLYVIIESVSEVHFYTFRYVYMWQPVLESLLVFTTAQNLQGRWSTNMRRIPFHWVTVG